MKYFLYFTISSIIGLVYAIMPAAGIAVLVFLILINIDIALIEEEKAEKE